APQHRVIGSQLAQRTNRHGGEPDPRWLSSERPPSSVFVLVREEPVARSPKIWRTRTVDHTGQDELPRHQRRRLRDRMAGTRVHRPPPVQGPLRGPDLAPLQEGAAVTPELGALTMHHEAGDARRGRGGPGRLVLQAVVPAPAAIRGRVVRAAEKLKRTLRAPFDGTQVDALHGPPHRRSSRIYSGLIATTRRNALVSALA